MKIYHNPRCKKSRAGLAFLEEKTKDFELINYIKEGISKEELKEIISKTGLSAEELIRKQEDAYKKGIKGKELSDAELIHAIADNPKLLKRPIIINGEKAVWADPPENLNNIL
ncbi:MAG: arsenate reductase (glutaredoxin) [Bacteroidetes bacterium]|nr:arsenate reductase (glutaredoxin) [Bacteroidota bacterium]MBU1580042.1 arsenate reductase (glutaredoxin) [Bacteroidota bacterium]MBU2465462.1 arsenate reductase (glutaredoxin) [Bacteroidota bacterium]MBU2557885.1 arsenate reductase (glutaredoxin) [Bacteroidota bacterium]